MMMPTECPTRCRTARQASRPSMCGNWTSRMIRSGFTWLSMARALTPSSTTATLNPSRSKYSWRDDRKRSSSSTMSSFVSMKLLILPVILLSLVFRPCTSLFKPVGLLPCIIKSWAPFDYALRPFARAQDGSFDRAQDGLGSGQTQGRATPNTTNLRHSQCRLPSLGERLCSSDATRRTTLISSGPPFHTTCRVSAVEVILSPLHSSKLEHGCLNDTARLSLSPNRLLQAFYGLWREEPLSSF